MDVNDLHPPDDYSHRFFIWHEWIQAYKPLTAANVFDYFASSMFYDKQSNNQVLRMQTIHTGIPIANEAEELRRFTGIEFAVVHSEPGPPSLFIIQKRERLSLDEVRPLASYFIINDRIYQSPDLYSVLSNRLLTTLHSLQSSLDVLRTYRPDFTPRSGFAWPIVQLASTTAEDDKGLKIGGEGDAPIVDDEAPPPLPSASREASHPSGTRKQLNQGPLFNAMRTTATYSKIAVPPFVEEPLPLLHSTPDSQSQVATPASNPGLPAAAAGVSRGSLTPLVGTPKGTPVISQEGLKGMSGGKKKKKRQSIAPTS